MAPRRKKSFNLELFAVGQDLPLFSQVPQNLTDNAPFNHSEEIRQDLIKQAQQEETEKHQITMQDLLEKDN